MPTISSWGQSLSALATQSASQAHLHFGIAYPSQGVPLWRCRYKKHAGIENYPPMQIIFATKVKNKGKLDSHCWYFDGLAYLLQPEYCILFDAGGSVATMPLRQAGLCTGPAKLPYARPLQCFHAAIQP
jgi:cellulose synthase/poly-beta-1,6-N-acetylglucosamine synthase-like glycosyltransferase